MGRYAAVIDTCALVPVVLADTLLCLADQGLYRPLWSDRITQDAVRVIHTVRPDLPSGAAQRRIDMMNHFFPDALVAGSELCTVNLDLPDPDDAHVIAAAIHGRADAIITRNLRDFAWLGD